VKEDVLVSNRLRYNTITINRCHTHEIMCNRITSPRFHQNFKSVSLSVKIRPFDYYYLRFGGLFGGFILYCAKTIKLIQYTLPTLSNFFTKLF